MLDNKLERGATSPFHNHIELSLVYLAEGLFLSFVIVVSYHSLLLCSGVLPPSSLLIAEPFHHYKNASYKKLELKLLEIKKFFKSF